MIGRLSGTLEDLDAEGLCLINVAGVGYEVQVPLGVLAPGKIPESNISLYIHTHVREDAFCLYGFPSQQERQVFRTLISISGIGPKLALAILGTLTMAQMAQLIEQSDVKTLCKVPGIGKKNAERILVELRGKAAQILGGATETNARPWSAPTRANRFKEVYEALIHLGYRPGEAERAIDSLLPAADDLGVEQLLKHALAELRP